MANHAKEKGKVVAVIHAAGMSPHMGDAKQIMEVNAPVFRMKIEAPMIAKKAKPGQNQLIPIWDK